MTKFYQSIMSYNLKKLRLILTCQIYSMHITGSNGAFYPGENGGYFPGGNGGNGGYFPGNNGGYFPGNGGNGGYFPGKFKNDEYHSSNVKVHENQWNEFVWPFVCQRGLYLLIVQGLISAIKCYALIEN